MHSDLHAERAILGAILLDNDAIYQCGDLKPQDFSTDAHRAIFAGMFNMAMMGKTVDLVSLVHDMQSTGSMKRVGGPEYVAGLVDGVPDNYNVSRYAEIVSDMARRRQLMALCAATIEQCNDGSESTADCVSVALERVLNLASNVGRNKSLKVSEYSAEVLRTVTTLAHTPLSDLPVGLTVGIPGVDRLTTGLRDGEFWIVASWTGEGKSLLCSQIIMENAQRGVPVLWFTPEMTKRQVMLRMIPKITNGVVKGRQLRDPRHMAASHLDEFKRAIGMIENWPIWVNDAAAMDVTSIFAHSMAMVRQHKVGLVVVDYIQLVRGQGESRYDKVTHVSNTLRELAKNSNVPVLAVSQLAKPERGEKRPPRIFDMKESGSIEQDAHVILMPFRPQEKDGRFTGQDLIIVGKQREGPTGAVKVRFDSLTYTFESKDEGDYDNEMF